MKTNPANPERQITIWERPNRRGRRMRATIIRSVCRVADRETCEAHIAGDPPNQTRMVTIPWE